MITRHETKATRRQRTEGEAALQPKHKLPQKPPAVLRGHLVASRRWRKMIHVYGELETEIVSLLDQDMLTDYCLLVEQVQEMDKLRRKAMKSWERAQAAFDRKLRKKAFEPKELARLQNAINATFDDIVKLDARADRKRHLLLTLRQSLYLTPRSRAGVAPQEKPPPKPKSKMAALIDEVTEYVNQPDPG